MVGKKKSNSVMWGTTDRARTDVRLPAKMVEGVEAACTALGIPKNGFHALASGLLLVKLAPLIPGQKRRHLLNHIEEMLKKALDEARKSA